MNEIATPVYLARQPIVDSRKNLFGYELLYRRGPGLVLGAMSVSDGARSLANALVEIGLNELVGREKAFVNVDEEMILSGALAAFPKSRVVIELLEHIRPTEEVIAEIQRLRKLGYTFALDDFVWNRNTEPLLPFVEIVKIDISQYDLKELPPLLARLSAWPVLLLAERVETAMDQEATYDMGFQLFQGFFFAKPQLVEGKALTGNHLALVRLLSRMNAPDLTLDELESIVVSEVQLNVRLLRFMKSAHFGMPSKVDSIRKMLLFVGLKTLAAVATVLMMSQFSNKPAELIHLAMVRAKMCEYVGQRLGSFETDRFFTLGMLSLLDALLDMPMRSVLEQLPLTEELEAVLLAPTADNQLARALRIVTAYEAGDFDSVVGEEFALEDAERAYRMASAWALQTQDALAA